MADTVSIDEVLSKFVSNEVDSTEVLKLLLTSDETGLNYLQNLKADFKDKYVIPTFNKAKTYYTNIEKKLEDPKNKEVLAQIGDPFGLKELHEEYKKKTKDILQKNLNRFENNLNVGNITNSKPASLSEQQTLTEKKQTFILADESIDRLGVVLGGINTENLKKLGKNASDDSKQKNDGGGLMSTLGGLLLAGGAAALLISAFWGSHIKPWLENKLDLKLDVFDKFEGIVEGIGKFFTMGGLKVTGGWLFNLVGKAFTTFGDLLEGGLSAIFKLGFGDDVMKEGVKAAPGAFKTLLPKIAGGLFKGAGLVAMKGIPIIGSLISFYFAYDRFNKGDTIGGIIDVLNGVASLVPGYGLPLSIGLSALNGFLDYKSGNVEGVDGQQSIKMDYVNKIVDFIQEIPIVGGLIKWGRGFWELGKGNWRGALNYLTETPFLGPFPAILQSLVNSNAFGTEGGEAFSWDKFQDELRKSMFRWILSFIPKVGGIRGKIAKWYGLEYDDNTGDIKINDDIGFSDENKTLDNNLIKKSAEKLDPNKVKYSEETEKKLLEMYNEQRKLEKERKEKYEKLKEESLDGWNPFADEEAEINARNDWETAQTSLTIIGNKLNNFKKLKPKQKNSPETSEDIEEVPKKFTPIKQDDFSFKNLMTSTEGNSILFDKNTNTANVLNENDNILAYKTDGVFDKALRELTNLVQSINKGIYKLPESLNNNNNSPSSVVISNTSGGGSGKNMMDVVLSGTRPDSIYNYRRSIQGEFA
jgi:hypothetical protein